MAVKRGQFEHYFGPEIAAIIQSRGVATKQGFLMHYSKDDAIGTKVSAAIEGVVDYQRLSLRGVPLYPFANGNVIDV